MNTLEKEEFCEGAKLLLSRIESHPEEFAGVRISPEHMNVLGNHWQSVVNVYWGYLSTAEQEAIAEALVRANREQLAPAVMRVIFNKSQRNLFEDREYATQAGTQP